MTFLVKNEKKMTILNELDYIQGNILEKDTYTPNIYRPYIQIINQFDTL